MSNGIPPAERDGALPERSNLTRSQYLIWTGQQMAPRTPLYNMALAFTIEGELNPDAFERAFASLVMASDALRTVIETRDGAPVQVVCDAIPAPLERLDLRETATPGALDAWLEERAARPFDLSTALYDSVLIRTGAASWVWFHNQHHLTTDGWTVALLYREMAGRYRLALEGRLDEAPDLPAYAAYRDWEREARSGKKALEAIDHWRNKGETAPPPLALYGRDASSAGTANERIFRDLGEARTRRLRERAETPPFRSLSPHLSQFHVIATVLFAFLHRASGQSELAIGAPSHNRPSATFKATPGLFIELFPLHATIEKGVTFEDLAKAVVGESYDFLRNALPGTSGYAGGGYQAVLNYINAAFGDFAGMPMHSTWVHPGHVDRGHALRLQVHDFDATGSIQLHFDLSTELLDDGLRQATPGHFLALLDACLADPRQPISAVPLLSAEERLELVDGYNDTARDFGEATVPAMIAAQVAANPEACALRCGDASLSYRELDSRADRLAGQLAAAVAGGDGPVGIWLPRSPELLISIVALFKLGRAYIPLDTAFPPARVQRLLERAGATVLLTDGSRRGSIAASGFRVIAVDGAAGENGSTIAATPVAGADTAYVIFTSGSTGEPKGVVVSHAALGNYIAWARDHYLGGTAVDMALFSTISADLTVTSLFLPLVSGGTVVIYPEGGDGADLAVMDVVDDDAVDLLKLTPSHLALVEERLADTSRLRALILGGEDLRSVLARRVVESSGGRLTILNEYGPTEATVGCMTHQYRPERDVERSVPIGIPIANSEIWLLDDQLLPVPAGLPGEIYIGGAGLADGYLNQPEETATRFIDHPFRPGERLYRTGDRAFWSRPGELTFLGRRDEQAKIRGFRIEPAEIESLLAAHPDIRDAAVVAMDFRPGGEVEPQHTCRNCGLAGNHPDAHLDADGICAVCRNFERIRSAAMGYLGTPEDLHAIFDSVKRESDGTQDCIMLYSGGKDSTYVLYQLVEMGMRPLVFSMDNGYISEEAKANIRRVVDDLGLELVWGATPAMNAIFVDSLKRYSNVCNGCFKTIYTLGINLARERGIRCIVTGLSRGQFFETRIADLLKGKVVDPADIDRAIVDARKAYHRMADAVSRHLDVSAFRDDRVFEEIRIVDYFRYSDVALAEMFDFLDRRAPWVRPSDTGRSTNCLINEAGIYVHKKERGYHNYTLPYSWDVRLGHKEREAALEELDDNIDETNVRRILDEIGYDESERVEARLTAYYVAPDTLSSAAVRDYLAEHLPAYMLPSHFMRLDTLPMTASGKLDRKALPGAETVLATRTRPYRLPSTPVEERLAAIWSEVLGVDPVGADDHFLDLGGTSLHAVQVVNRINREFEMTMPLHAVFDTPTVAQLAVRLEEALLDELEALDDDTARRLLEDNE